jgi:DNA-binding IclR family transcriptional regulator
MLVYDNYTNSPSTMSKPEILEIFARAGSFLTPDRVRLELRPHPDRRSVYSYLLRLKRQGLLEAGPNRRRGYLAYRLTERGQARLRYFCSRRR